jgi:hypothetical protein
MNTVDDPRRAGFTLAAAGIAAGLPVPFFVQVGRDTDVSRAAMLIQLVDDDRHGVDQWAAWLNLRRPALEWSPLHSNDRWWQPYGATGRHPATGRTVWVKSHVTVPAPAEATGGAR